MATRSGHQEVFTRIASGDLAVGRVATIVGNDARLATSGELAYPVTHRADNNQHVGLVGGGHAKVTYAGSLGIGTEVMAGNGYVTLAASGQFVIGVTLTAADSGLEGEILVSHYRKLDA